MKNYNFLLVFFTLILGCLQTRQVSNFKEISSNHKTIAILPADATFLINEKEKRKISEAQLDESELKLGFMIQNEMNKSFSKKAKNYKVSVADIKKTNELLFAKGLSFQEYKMISKDSLAKILNVDAVMYCSVRLSKKMSNVEYDVKSTLEMFVLPIPIAVIGSQYRVEIQIGLVEKTNPTVIWKTDYHPTGKKQEDIFGIMKRMFELAASNFPYRK
jgi:LysM repeat protein